MNKRIAAFAVSLLLGAVATCASAQTRYAVQGLGNAGKEFAFATGLSENGLVTAYGFNLDATGFPIAQAYFTYASGVTTMMGSYNGLPIAALSINSAGSIAAYSYDPATLAYQRALQVASGQVTDLGTLGGARAQARAINEQGQLTGGSRLASGTPTHAFLSSGGVMTDLGAPAGTSSSGRAINNSGVVAGIITPSGGNSRSAIFDHGAIVDLGTFGGDSSVPYAINEASQVVGYVTYNSSTVIDFRPFLYSNGTMTDLGVFQGRAATIAMDINNRGQIVGIAFNEDEFDNQVFLREGAQMLDVNTLLDAGSMGWTITDVNEINDRGQIAGSGIFNGVRQAVLLTPVPEVPAAPMLVAGLLLLTSKRRLWQRIV